MNGEKILQATEISKISIQDKIEIVMRDLSEEERWESMYLFSSEGLLMARVGDSKPYDEGNLVEFGFSLIETVKLLNGHLPTKEIIIRGKERKILVFQYFDAWDDQLILATIVSGKRGYRRAIKKVIKLIQELGE
jgi:hypothetical protein